jgi:Peroxiredoxin
MNKNYIILFFFAFLLSACGSNADYRIEGKLKNLENPLIYIIYEGSGDKLIDSVSCITPGEFIVELNKENINTATLFFEDREISIVLYPEPKQKVTISGDMKYPSLLQIKGGRINDKLNDFRKSISETLKEETDITNTLLRGGEIESTATDTRLVSELTNLRYDIEEAALNYICNNPKEKASVVLIERFFTDPYDTRKLDEMLAVLDPELSSFFLAKDLRDYSSRAKRTTLGATAPPFSVKDIHGKQVSLDSLSSDYKLLTFTAPWCEMCRIEVLNLDQIVKQYDKKNIDILLISLDDNPGEVRNLLKEDSIRWNLVTDSANQAIMLLDLYNVSALPYCLVIDQEGKIILKTNNGEEIRQTLGSLIKE